MVKARLLATIDDTRNLSTGTLHPAGRDVIVGDGMSPWLERWSIAERAFVPFPNRGPEGFVAQLAEYAPDGSALAVYGKVESDAVIVLLDAADALVETFRHPNLGFPYWYTWHPSRHALVSSHEVDGDSMLVFWQLDAKPIERLIRRPDRGEHGAFSRDGRWLVEKTYPGELVRIDAESWEETVLATDVRSIVGVFAGAKDEIFVVRETERVVEMWNVAAGEKTRTIAYEGPHRPRSFDPTGALAFATEGRALDVFDMTTGKVVHKEPLRTKGDWTWEHFTPDGKLLVTCGYDTKLFALRDGGDAP
jgi:hypothetical protein